MDVRSRVLSFNGELCFFVAESTARVTKEQIGTLMGLEHGSFSAARIIGPATGVFLLEAAWGGAYAVDLVCSSVCCGVLFCWLLWGPKPPAASGVKEGKSQ